MSFVRSRWPAAVVAGAIIILAVRAASTYRVFTHTVDEPFHIGSGMEMIQYNTYTIARAAILFQPPLGRMALAVGPYWHGCRLVPEADREAATRKVLYSGRDYWTALRLARLPVLLFAAATMLDHLLDPRSVDAFIDAMAQPAVRDIAVGTLKKLGAIRERIDDVFNALRDVEGASEREEARMSTVINLLGIGRPSVEILIEYLEDDDWLVREAAADLLGKIGDVRAVEPLMKRLAVDQDTGVKELAIKALGLIGDARPTQLYLEAIPIRPLRVYAMEALAKIKDVEVLRPHKELFDRLRTDRDGLVAYNAGLIADKLEAMDSAHAMSQEGHHE